MGNSGVAMAVFTSVIVAVLIAVYAGFMSPLMKTSTTCAQSGAQTSLTGVSVTADSGSAVPSAAKAGTPSDKVRAIIAAGQGYLLCATTGTKASAVDATTWYSASPRGAFGSSEYAIVRIVLQYIPAIIAIGIMYMVWYAALKNGD